jgi:hypothetical protein
MSIMRFDIIQPLALRRSNLADPTHAEQRTAF